MLTVLHVTDEPTSYPEADWTECVPADFLAGIGAEELGLLHRHFIWANYQRTLFDRALQEPDRDDQDFALLAGGDASTMLLWYSLLWALIEGFDDRGLRPGGLFGEDIEAVSDLLRRGRNAVLHVPRKGDYWDTRIVEMLSEPTLVIRVRRITKGFGRMFLEEIRRRISARDNQVD